MFDFPKELMQLLLLLLLLYLLLKSPDSLKLDEINVWRNEHCLKLFSFKSGNLLVPIFSNASVASVSSVFNLSNLSLKFFRRFRRSFQSRSRLESDEPDSGRYRDGALRRSIPRQISNHARRSSRVRRQRHVFGGGGFFLGQNDLPRTEEKE